MTDVLVAVWVVMSAIALYPITLLPEAHETVLLFPPQAEEGQK